MERNNGYFGQFGGAFVPEELKNVLKDVEEAFYKYIEDEEFLSELAYYQRQYIGRENPLYLAKRLSDLDIFPNIHSFVQIDKFYLKILKVEFL